MGFLRWSGSLVRDDCPIGKNGAFATGVFSGQRKSSSATFESKGATIGDRLEGLEGERESGDVETSMKPYQLAPVKHARVCLGAFCEERA
jgi:hypothetical protein